jgi:hypothetical protein
MEIYQMTFEEYKELRDVPQSQKEKFYGNLSREHSAKFYDNETIKFYYEEVRDALRRGKEILPQALDWYNDYLSKREEAYKNWKGAV